MPPDTKGRTNLNDRTAGKVEFAGTAWIEIARAALEELVAAHGNTGSRFSLCEVFTDAPLSIAATGTTAWHFYVDGTTVVVATGEVDDADVKIVTDYQGVLPTARQYYTPEVLAERAARPPGEGFDSVQGDMSLVPDYLVELHNRLSLITA
jgi:hypothetical protein